MSRSRAGFRWRAALALLAALVPGLAQALGLGEIEVYSRLNQPLAASIPVLAGDAAELEGMTVELASLDDFERAGLERAEFLSALRFEITGKAIKVSSKDNAREPFVSFLLDVRFGGGRLLREYTILLDPPTLAQRQPQPSRAPAVAPAPVVRTPAPAATPAPSPAESTAAPAATPPTERPPTPKTSSAAPASLAGATRYGPVKPHETLWSVALKVRPDPMITMDQVQLAIFQANPQSFDDGQLGKLMKGVTLQIPDAASMAALDPAQARAAVAAARSGSPAPAAPVRIDPPAAAAMPPQSAPVPAPAAATEQPEPKLEPAAPAEPAPAATATTQPQLAPPAGEPTAAPAETPAAEPAPVAPAPAAPESPAEQGFVAELSDRIAGLSDSPLFLPALGAFLLLLVGAVAAKKIKDRLARMAYERASRRDSTAAPMASVLGADLDVTSVAPESAAMSSAPSLQQTLVSSGPMVQSPPSMASTQNYNPQGQTQALEPALAATGGKLDFDVTGNFANETVQINLDAGDPVSEAEFHRAYGLYDEASLLLKQALQKDPNRKDARVKLAEIYFEASKAPEFVATARELKAQLAPDEWQKIALMGTQIAPGDDLFAGADAGAGAVDLSFDDVAPLTTASPSAAPASAPAAAAAAGGDDMLDFKLDDIQLPDTPSAPSAAPAQTENMLEFDLGSLGLDTPQAAAPAPAAPASPSGNDEISLDLGDFDLKLDAPAEASPQTEALGGLDLGGDLSVDPVAGGDESSTKLDLARAYIDMGDNDMARSLLNEVAQQGTPMQKQEAQELLKRVAG